MSWTSAAKADRGLPPSAPMVTIAGPTASGKTALACALAQHFAGEIISCDSAAVYRGCEIGTAKPSAGQRSLIPHHLLDIVAPDEFFTAGDYARQARAAAAAITARGRLPIVCGGTGLYLRAMLEGLFAGPPRDEALREHLRRRHRGGALWRLLRRMDPPSARRIHPNDEAKLIRAIEVSAAAARPMSELLEEGRDELRGYRVLRLGLNPPRDRLYERIDLRCRRMFDEGLIEETRGLLDRYGPEAPVLRALGYRQAAEYLRGACSLDEAIAAAQQGHRNYAKRQLTWFRRDAAVRWIEGFGDDASVIAGATEIVSCFLASPVA